MRRGAFFTYINAGHNNPILRRSNGSIERLDVGGLPIGIQAEAKYESASVTLAPGDWLIIFTDGLVEAENARQEEYGEARLLSAIAARRRYNSRRNAQSPDGRTGSLCRLRLRSTIDVTCLLVKAE